MLLEFIIYGSCGEDIMDKIIIKDLIDDFENEFKDICYRNPRWDNMFKKRIKILRERWEKSND